MSTPNGEAGCAFSPEHGLVIAGGTSGSDVLGSNAVINTRDGETFEALPPMPVAKVEHCLVALDDGDLLVTGGLSPLPSEKTYIFSSTSWEWVEVADMPTGRYTLMCGSIQRGGNQEVVAAGGFYFHYFDMVEIYSVEDNLWRTGKFFKPIIYLRIFKPNSNLAANPLPQNIYGATTVPFQDSFLIVGGGSDTPSYGFLDTIYKYEADADSWTLLHQSLTRPLIWTGALMVDVEIFPTCQRLI